MKRIIILTGLIVFSLSGVFSNIVTNTNQSAVFFRFPSLNASLDIDATYYNPAGLIHLQNGWHIALHNQTIYQEKTVLNAFPLLNESSYVGEVKAPIFPNLYVVYKKENFAFSFGFGPNSGGGSADFTTGLPSFEIPISSVPALVSSLGLPTTAYSADIAFKGTSVFYGFQFNGSYAFNEVISVAAGIRYIHAVNTYEGAIENIMINPMHPLINPTGAMLPAPQFFNLIGLPSYAAMLSDKAVDVKQVGTGFTPILSMNIRPNNRLNIGIRYEFNTKLELENETTQDDTGMFPDGEKSRNDIPAILSFGIDYYALTNLRLSFSFGYYFDKNTNWDGRENLIDSNTYDFGLGIEYHFSDTFLMSAGYTRTQIGVSEDYQTDFSHEISSNTYGAGARVRVGKSLDLDLGLNYSKYVDSDKTFIDLLIGSYKETYQRWNWGVSVGIGYHF